MRNNYKVWALCLNLKDQLICILMRESNEWHRVTWQVKGCQSYRFCSLTQRTATPIMPCCGEKCTRTVGKKQKSRYFLFLFFAKMSPTLPRVCTSQTDRTDVLTPCAKNKTTELPYKHWWGEDKEGDFKVGQKTVEDHISITWTINGNIQYIFF